MATNDKYDRQLRLWGAKGQRALSETSVLLLRATAAGTETMKNLVLPGIGHFHILDDVLYTSQQGASNFFVPTSCNDKDNNTRKTRAQVACEYLQELNPDVRGTHHHVDSLAGISDWKSMFQSVLTSSVSTSRASSSKKMVVIASELEPTLLLQVSLACQEWENQQDCCCTMNLIMIQSYGLIGIVRLQVPRMGGLPLLDPKPTNIIPDLRLYPTPLPEFVKVATEVFGMDWSTLSDKDHHHVPYPFILYKVGQEWKQKHNDTMPSTYQEKQEFRTFIQSHSRDFNNELNFQEAVDNAYLAYTEPTMETNLEDLLFKNKNDSKDSMLQDLVHALQKFQSIHQRCPINGSIPDMTSSTDHYVVLQNIYRNQATKDIEEMKSFLPSSSTASDDDLEAFCSNVYRIGKLETRSIHEEYTSPSTDEEMMEDWMMATMDPYEVPEHTPLLWYLAVRGCHVFYQQYQRYPGIQVNANENDDKKGSTSYQWEKDIPLLHECIRSVLEQFYPSLKDNDWIQEMLLKDDRIATEMTRYANAEIHTIASVVGGVASQEAVKVITGQYVPLNNTYVFNGIVSVAGMYRF